MESISRIVFSSFSNWFFFRTNFGLRLMMLGERSVSLPWGFLVGTCSAAAKPVSTMATKVKTDRVILTLGFIA